MGSANVSGSEIIDVLNYHATVLADEGKAASIKYCCLFNEFIRLFEESGFDEGFLKEDGGELRKHYADLVDYRDRDERYLP